ncbi:class I SAM-dependent methyltransferase [Coraliomargarita sp. SDUM461004]|uniref:Class I SAM-dependent methyltransferase n=1 Tax=Thalassobacterium sedimentorum TaxID=3041258 RepID=A0ABU1ANY3_9BACT|nr:class I SAM-dependent methyltransferase [Coraliomargarita sp. SDUM461004]MDQ8195323.1 class I SAM-dependent methyltransferase [Coraliomargarita sp. SDUM461004]
MDPKTIEAYDTHAAVFAARYRSGERVPVERLKLAFGHRWQILDIGVGSGVDMSRFLDAGYDVRGVEPSLMLMQTALKHFPRLQGRIWQGSLPMADTELFESWQSHYMGIFCSAVLMHIAYDQQPLALEQMYAMLKPEGRLLLTVSSGRTGLNAQGRDEYNRFYAELSEDRVLELAQHAGFIQQQTWHDADKWHREGLVWASYLFEKPKA